MFREALLLVDLFPVIYALEKRFSRGKMVEFITANGAQLAYELSGPKDAPLMITLHGGRGMGKFR